MIKCNACGKFIKENTKRCKCGAVVKTTMFNLNKKQKHLLTFIVITFPLYIGIGVFLNSGLSLIGLIVFYLAIPIMYEAIFFKTGKMEVVPFIFLASGCIEMLYRFINHI